MKKTKPKAKEPAQQLAAAPSMPQIESTPLKYGKDENGKTTLSIARYLTDDSGLSTDETRQKRLKEIVGVNDTELADSIVYKGSHALEETCPEQHHNLILQSLNDLKPKDVIESRLITQETVLHSELMKNLYLFSASQNFGEAEWRVSLITKLTKLHNETIETFSRYRRGGKQLVTVQHTVVDNRAVVNNFSGVGVGGINENKGETSCSSNCVEQGPSRLAIDHVASPQWPMENVACMAEKVPAQKLKKAEEN